MKSSTSSFFIPLCGRLCFPLECVSAFLHHTWLYVTCIMDYEDGPPSWIANVSFSGIIGSGDVTRKLFTVGWTLCERRLEVHLESGMCELYTWHCQRVKSTAATQLLVWPHSSHLVFHSQHTISDRKKNKNGRNSTKSIFISSCNSKIVLPICKAPNPPIPLSGTRGCGIHVPGCKPGWLFLPASGGSSGTTYLNKNSKWLTP